MGRVYAVHQRSIHPAMRVCKEWGPLLLNEEVKVVRENQKATDWINSFFSSTSFMNAAQATAPSTSSSSNAGDLLAMESVFLSDVL